MDPNTTIIVAPHDGIISNLKKVNKQINKGTILASIDGTTIESQYSGKIIEICTSPDALIRKGSVIAKIELCKHPAIYAGLCISCGEKLNSKTTNNNNFNNDSISNRNRNYNSQKSNSNYGTSITVSGGRTLQLSEAEASSSGSNKRSGLQSAQKLALILDLDLTLIHCIQRQTNALPIEGCHDFTLNEGRHQQQRHHFRCRLRPNALKFLQEASKFCQLSVYTHGTRNYAAHIASILDPDGSLIGQRIVSRTDTADIGTGVKSLERIMGDSTSLAVIMDDNEEVWRAAGGEEHLLAVKPFVYFDEHTHKGVNGGVARVDVGVPGAESDMKVEQGEEKKVEEVDDQLEKSLIALKYLHSVYYSKQNLVGDNSKGPYKVGEEEEVAVNIILRDFKAQILEGCTICLLGRGKAYGPQHADEERFMKSLEHMARNMGAVIETMISDNTTHVVLLSAPKGGVLPLWCQPHVDSVVVEYSWLRACWWNLNRMSEKEHSIDVKLKIDSTLPARIAYHDGIVDREVNRNDRTEIEDGGDDSGDGDGNDDHLHKRLRRDSPEKEDADSDESSDLDFDEAQLMAEMEAQLEE